MIILDVLESAYSGLREVFSLGVQAEALRANIGSKSSISIQRGPLDQKFQAEWVALHQPFFSSEN